ncbi:MAG TPA: dTMP kinase [Candidatus Limnocylindrales bacterium]|nr:dTMP kinase [Candidatus Limnocylindrales bacterium]
MSDGGGRGNGPGPGGRGWFITLEGPEGAGKTTQARALAARIEALGLAVVVTREPGGTPVAERIRDVLLAQPGGDDPLDARADALLFNAARAQHVARLIRPAVEAGTTVVCARFADSTVAYQGFGRGVPVDELRAIERFATGGLVPDLTIVLDVPVEVGLARKVGESNRFETTFDRAFHERVRAAFRSLAAAEPERFVVVDATAPAELVADHVAAAASRLPGLGALASAGPGTSRNEPDARVERIYG